MTEIKGDILTVDKLIQRLSKQRAEHVELWKAMIAADGGKIFPMDLYVQGVLNRSNYLIAGFLSLIQANNYHCAASLVRLHLDNAVRLSAAWLVSDPHKFASDVMAGKSIRTLRDSTGEKMNDAYLVRKLSKEFPWVQNVYDETCGFIHLSEKHIFQSLRESTGEDSQGSFDMLFSVWQSDVPEESVIEGLECMIEITEVVLHYVAGWVVTKDKFGTH